MLTTDCAEFDAARTTTIRVAMTTSNEHELWKRFEAATAARDRGELKEARAILHAILHAAPLGERKLITATHQQLGYIAGSLEDPPDLGVAAGHFDQAVELSPRSELSSLGLFHALNRAGRLEDALREAVRYLTLRDCGDYRAMLTEGFGMGISARAQELLLEGRALLARWDHERDNG